jgi:hypothetical protein
MDGIGMSLNFIPGTNIPVVADLAPGKVADRCGKIKIGKQISEISTVSEILIEF